MQKLDRSLRIVLMPRYHRETHERIRNTPFVMLLTLENEAFLMQFVCLFIIPTSGRCICQIVQRNVCSNMITKLAKKSETLLELLYCMFIISTVECHDT